MSPGKRVLVRLDLNVPMENGRVTDATRIERQAPTMVEIADKGGKVNPAVTFGPAQRTKPEASRCGQSRQRLPAIIGRPVAFAEDCVGPDAPRGRRRSCGPATFCVWRTRAFIPARKRTTRLSWQSSPRWATCSSTTRSPPRIGRMPRPKGSRTGFRLMPAAACRPSSRLCRGRSRLRRGRWSAIVGGAKVSTKLDLLGNLLAKVDALIIGGGMANTFLAALGKPVGKSLAEHDLARHARADHEQGQDAWARQIVLPIDAVVAQKFEAQRPSEWSTWITSAPTT